MKLFYRLLLAMLLLGAISHDLKTYITRLRLRIEQLPDDAQRDKKVEGGLPTDKHRRVRGSKDPSEPSDGRC